MNEQKCPTCGTEIPKDSYSHLSCSKCNPKKESKQEKEIVDFIKSFGFKVIKNDKKLIAPYSLAIVVPEKNLAIEFNELMRNSACCKEEENKGYHLAKTDACRAVDYQLLHVFESEWDNPLKQKIWKSIIKTKLGINQRIFARKTETVVMTDNTQIKQFLEDNHMQGFIGSEVKIGLFDGLELIAMATFKKPAYNNHYDYEIARYVNKEGFSVIGGFSKIMKYFEKHYNWKTLITYADMRYSVGNVYKQYGFEEKEPSKPNYFYFKPDEKRLRPRVKFQKHKLHEVLEIFDPTKTESENVYANGYRRIWDAGNKVMVYTKPE